MPFTSESEMLEAMAEVVQKSSGITLEHDHIRELLLEVQREQLKGLVYRAFMAVTQAKEELSADTATTEQST